MTYFVFYKRGVELEEKNEWLMIPESDLADARDNNLLTDDFIQLENFSTTSFNKASELFNLCKNARADSI